MADSKESQAQVTLTKMKKTLSKGATTDEIAALYDAWAGLYDQELKGIYRGPSKLAELFQDVCGTRSVEILDWGSDTGMSGEKLHEHGYTNLTAVDVSQKSLDVASKKGIYKKLVKLGDSKVLFGNDEFDPVVSCGSIIPNHVKPEIFYEWVRIVKPGGIIAIVMRRDYIVPGEGSEEFFSEDLRVEFQRVAEDLETKNQWERILDGIEFVGYTPESDGLAFIFKTN